jgi:hypothetical protein
MTTTVSGCAFSTRSSCETSVVVFPMNPAAVVTGVKTADVDDAAALDERLEAKPALVALTTENDDYPLGCCPRRHR